MICLTPLHKLTALAKLSGCQNKPILWKNHDNIFFLAANWQKIQTVLKLLWLFLMLNSNILSFIRSGTAYFVVNYTNTFLPGDRDRKANWRTWATYFYEMNSRF